MWSISESTAHHSQLARCVDCVCVDGEASWWLLRFDFHPNLHTAKVVVQVSGAHNVKAATR